MMTEEEAKRQAQAEMMVWGEAGSQVEPGGSFIDWVKEAPKAIAEQPEVAFLAQARAQGLTEPQVVAGLTKIEETKQTGGYEMMPGEDVKLPVSPQAPLTSFGSILPWLVAAGGYIYGLLSKGSTGQTAGVMTSGLLNQPGANISSLPLVGPGVPEPPNYMVRKRWETYSGKGGNIKCNFYALIDGRIAMYNNTTGTWRVWRPKKHIVISSDPRMSQITKLERTYDKVIRRLAKKSRALKMAK